MPLTIDGIQVLISGNMKQLEKSLTKASASLTQWGSRMQGIGTQMSARITAPLLAIGGAAVVAANEVDSAFSTIRAGTGATGDALGALQNDFRAVAGNVPNDMNSVAVAIADLNTRTGATGDQLRRLSTQMLQLSRLTGSDVAGNVESITRLFGDWSVATEDQSEAMNMLWRASQSTGASVDYLSRSMVQYGAPLRQLGFTMEQSTALFGKWNKEGVNSELIMGGMRQAIGVLARAGATDLPAAFRQAIRVIRETEDSGTAASMAMNLFGARAGADIASAIQEGRFEIDEFVRSLQNSEETIGSAGEQTKTLSDRMNNLMNRIKLAAEPIGSVLIGALERLEPVAYSVIGYMSDLSRWFTELSPDTQTWSLVIAGLVAAMGPLFVIIGTVATSIGAIIGAVSIATIKIAAIAAVVVAAVAAFVIWYRSSERAQQAVSSAFARIQESVSGVMTKLNEFWTRHRETVMSVLSRIGSAMESVFVNLAAQAARDFTNTINAVGDVITWLSGVMDGGLSPSMIRAMNAVNRVNKVFADLGRAMWSLFGPYISASIEEMGRKLSIIWSVMRPILSNSLAIALTIAAEGARGFLVAIEGITGAIEGLVQIINGEWDEGWDKMVSSMERATRITDAIGQRMTGSILGSFRNMYDELVGHSIVPDTVDGITSEFEELAVAMRVLTGEATSSVELKFGKMSDTVIAKMRNTVNEVKRLDWGSMQAVAGFTGKGDQTALGFQQLTKGAGGAGGLKDTAGMLTGLMSAAGGALDIANMIPGLNLLTGPLSAIMKGGALVDAGKKVWGGIKKLKFWGDGGIITQPIQSLGQHVMGEAGPEAIVPLTRLPQFMNDVGGGGKQIQVNVDLDGYRMASVIAPAMSEVIGVSVR